MFRWLPTHRDPPGPFLLVRGSPFDSARPPRTSGNRRELAITVPDQELRPAASILLACSMTASTYKRVPVNVTVSLEEAAGEQCLGLGTEEVRPRGGALGRRVDPGLPEDLPHRGGGGPDPEDE